MLRAYIDDSHTVQSAFVLAGYIATVENWALFSDEWQNILDMSPPLARFKMSEAHSSWSDEQWNLRLPLLYGTIERYASAGVSLLIPFQEYLKVFAGKKYASNPYNFAFYEIVPRVAQKQNELGLTEPIDFIFDKGNEERVTIAWDQFKANAPSEIRDFLGEKPTFGNDETMWPLQAADLLAWIRRRAFHARQDPTLKTRTIPWVKTRDLPYLEIESTPEAFRRAYNWLYSANDAAETEEL